jgi:hypothetical protein
MSFLDHILNPPDTSPATEGMTDEEVEQWARQMAALENDYVNSQQRQWYRDWLKLEKEDVRTKPLGTKTP